MRNFHVLTAIVLLLICSPRAQAAIPWSGNIGTGADDGLITMVYDPANGKLSMDAAGKEITALEILSAGGYFTGTKPEQVNGLFDVFTPTKMFILKPGAARFSDQDFGTVMAPGLSALQVAADLTVTGALFPSGGLGTVDLVKIPEPTTSAIWGLGLVRLHRNLRHRRKA